MNTVARTTLISSIKPQILLAGATGFIGGTVLAHLLASPSPALRSATVICLVRGSDRVATLLAAYGDRVHPVVYKDLDDLKAITAAATQADLVINTTLGYHLPSAQALIRGLAQRKVVTGRDVWFVQTSGTSNLSDQPISGKYVEKDPAREFDDANDDIYGYEKMRDALHPYIQRTCELGVVDMGLALEVKTLVIMSPTIYGVGTGLFNTISIQIPSFIRGVLQEGHGVVVGDGSQVKDRVHVQDVADLYTLVAEEAVGGDGRALPSGKEGIIFSANGRFTWRKAVQGVVDACCDEGAITDRELKSVGLAEAARIWSSYLEEQDEDMVELGLAGNARTLASVARKMGWKPTHGEEAWRKGFKDDVKAVLEEKK